MPSFATLRTAIKTKLDTMLYNAGSNPSGVLMQVQDVHLENFTGFPAVTFEPSNHENNYYSNNDNMRAYAFDVIVWQEMESGGRAQAINSLTAAVDAIITAFDSDFNLTGACDFCVPIPSAWGEVLIGGATFKYAKMTIVCKSEIQVVS